MVYKIYIPNYKMVWHCFRAFHCLA